MSFNIVEIQVVTDYTDFSNTVRFHLNVPVTADEADTVTEALAGDTWDKVQGDIMTAVKNAPQPIQDLVGSLMKAYSGKAPSPSGQPDKPKNVDEDERNSPPTD